MLGPVLKNSMLALQGTQVQPLVPKIPYVVQPKRKRLTLKRNVRRKGRQEGQAVCMCVCCGGDEVKEIHSVLTAIGQS